MNKILKVTKRGYDTFVTIRLQLPRSDIDGIGMMNFEESVTEALRKSDKLSLKAIVLRKGEGSNI